MKGTSPSSTFSMTNLLHHALQKYSLSGSELVTYNGQDLQLPAGQHLEFDSQSVIETLQAEMGGPSDGLRIPLHEPDSAELSGEHVELKITDLDKTLVYNDSSRGRSRQSLSSVHKTQIGHRIRFWTDRYHPDSTPSYAPELTTAEDNTETLQATPINPLTSREKWFSELVDFVDTLEEQKRAENKENYVNQPFYRYAKENGGIDEVVALSHGSHPDYGELFTFSVPADDEDNPDPLDLIANYGLYPDMEVLIDPLGESNYTRDSVSAIRANLVKWDEDERTVSLSLIDSRSRTTAQVLIDDTEVFRIAGLLNRVPFNREREAISSSKNDATKSDVLLGGCNLDFEPQSAIQVQTVNRRSQSEDEPLSREWFYNPGRDDPVVGGIELNEYQAEAAERALRANHVYCIHGPPGTGKTRTLKAITRQIIAEGGRVLVCAHSNSAVDNLIVGDSSLDGIEEGSLHELAQEPLWDLDVTIARTGNGSENDVVKEHYTTVSADTANIVATTASGADEFSKNEFDLAIFDEATQANIPSTLIPFVCSEKLVLAGDHKQLPPYKSTEAENRPIHVSLFEHLLDVYDSGIHTILRRQYRMNDQIVDFPNEAFYDGKLQSGEENANWTVPDEKPLIAVNVAGEEEASGHSKKNLREARVVAKRIESLRSNGVPMSDIGVITAYRGQIRPIKEILDDHVDGRTQYIKVDTIDSFQGSEREAIVVSFVRSNPDGNSGFLTLPDEGPRRLNVALTRAKKHLSLVGDFETLGKTPSHKNDSETCSEIYAALADSLRERGLMREPSRPTSAD